MSNAETAGQPPLRWGNAHRHFLAHLVVMPGWHKAVILIAGTIAVLGTVGQMAARVKPPPPAAPPSVQGQPARPSGSGSSSSFVNESDRPGGSGAAAPAPPAPAADTLLGRVSPHATKLGLSVVLGFIVGWLFRAFIKTMAMIALVAIGGLWLLSHFGILHFAASDVDGLRERAGEAASWLERHARQLKDVAIAHLPSTGGGALGAFLGFRRR